MAMMVPMRRNRNLLSELMTDPFDAFFNAASAPMQKMSPTLMRTDYQGDRRRIRADHRPAGLQEGRRPGRAEGRLPHHHGADPVRVRGQGRRGHVRPQGAASAASAAARFYVGDGHRGRRHQGEVRGRRAEDRRAEEAGAAQARGEEDHLHRGLILRETQAHRKAATVAAFLVFTQRHASVVCARDDRRSRAKQADQNACFT